MENKDINLRILVTGFTANRGGVETFMINYIEAIRKSAPNIYFDILGYEEHPAFENEIMENEGKIYTVPSPRHRNSPRKIDDFFKMHGSEYKILWCNKCDLANIDYLKKAKKYGIPNRIIHSHSSANMHYGIKRKIFTSLHHMNKKQIMQFATDFWACSDYAAKWMYPEELIEKEFVCYIPNAIDLNKFLPNSAIRNEYREHLKIEGNTVYIFVGHLSTVKNPEFAINVFAEIWHKNPKSVLLVVGTGELETVLEEKLKKKSYKSNVRFLGSRDDVPKLLQAADCFLMPSFSEGFPVASIEAQAAGLPVFAASDGITKQAQLTPLFHFLPLSAGATKWAEKIMESDLLRGNYKKEICEKSFDIESAAQNLQKRLYEMIENKM